MQGDKSSRIYVKSSQVLKYEVIEGTKGSATTAVHINVEKDAVLHVPTDLTVDGTELIASGLVTFKNLVVDNGGAVFLYPTSTTGLSLNNKYVNTSKPGSYFLSSLILKHGTVFKPQLGLDLSIGSLFEMKRFVVLEAEYIDITAGKINLERGSQLSVRGKAPHNPLSPHAGKGLNGGAHTSEGGVEHNETLTNVAVPYGSIYRPTTMGSSGGGNGGRGGSTINIYVDELRLDGILNANGGSSSNGGGGSGGSILVKCDVSLQGLGEMTANGGDAGSIWAGAGSGGRIYVSTKKSDFQGQYRAHGGYASSVYGKGGPGSIYIQIEQEYDNLVEYFTVDNSNGQLYHYLTLNETADKLDFANIFISNYAKLQIIKDSKMRSINIKKVHGDGTGLLRLRQNQLGTLERISAANDTNSKLALNLELHDGGEFIMSETTTILGKAPVALELDGIMRGAMNLIVGENRKIKIGRNAKIIPFTETGISKQSNVTFGYFQLDPGSIVDFEPDTGANMIVGTLDIKFRSKMTADYFNITCTDISIEASAILSSSSADRVVSDSIDVKSGSPLLNGAGAGHGGNGGVMDSNTTNNNAYGSIYTPNMSGSRAGKTGRGGGWINLHIGRRHILDGQISTDGSSSSNGGGSGGSIMITCRQIEGFGLVSSRGGNGLDGSGAGAGGRIALYAETKSRYEGKYIAYGGVGKSPMTAAGAGTVFLHDVRNRLPYRILRCDNNNNPSDKYAVITEIRKDSYNFDEVHLTNKASLEVQADSLMKNVTFDVRQFYGDGTGLLHIHKNQKTIAEYEESSIRAFTSAVNFFVDIGGELVMPGKVFVYGKGIQLSGYPEKRSIQLEGLLTGVKDLMIGRGNSFYMGRNAHTAMLQNRQYIYKDDPGHFRFGLLDLNGNSVFKQAPDGQIRAQIGIINIRYKATLSAESILLNVSSLNVEAGAMITASAADRPLDTIDSEKGTGGNNAGGSHASTGGGDQTENIYGSLYKPDVRGSRGGNQGGSGGGQIRMIVADKLHNDGVVTVDGSKGVGGGGSAGSIWIEAGGLEGHGVFRGIGGEGKYGGSGGRIAIYLTEESLFKGTYKAVGGQGNEISKASGGPGTVYLSDHRFGRLYQQLRIDHAGRDWNQYLTLDEPSKVDYYFDELHLTGGASLDMKLDYQEKTLMIRKIYGDKTGRIHMRSNQSCHLERSETSKGTLKTPVNLWIDEGAKAYLASLVYILGEGEVALKWNGDLIDVRHLRIVPGKKISIGAHATSSYFDEKGELKEGKPGELHFSSLELGAKSVMKIPPPIGLRMTVSLLVNIFQNQCYIVFTIPYEYIYCC